jgi:predicted outer membrane repeat protein
LENFVFSIITQLVTEEELLIFTFNDNNATFGGAVYIDEEGITTSNDYTFNYNKARKNGGAVYINKEGITTFNNCTFNDNNTTLGGVVYVYKGNTTFNNCTFNNNEVTDGEGTI